MENKNLPNNFQRKNETKVMNILNENGIKSLRPPQQKVLNNNLLDKNKNFLICIPTASGKTLIGEMAFINHLLDENKQPTGKKGLFIVPLKALANEKYDEFKEKYEKYGLKVALSIGDFDEKENLSSYDLIITTAEKLDSLMRHRIDWIDKVSVVVVDEIHLIGDDERGGTLEIILTKLKNLNNIQLIGLSATVGNPEELANWLNATLVIDDWRPVELKKGIFYKNKIEYIDENNSLDEITKSDFVALRSLRSLQKPLNDSYKNDIMNLVVDCIDEDGSCLIFCNSKRGAVSEAKKLNLKKYLSHSEKHELQKLKDEVLSIFDPPTETCRALAECIEKGVAFHHAGLTYEQRKIVEEGFRKKLIKVICCTPTLCLNANTEILQESGFKKITELNKNEKVFALCGNKIRPVDCWKVHKTPQHEYNIVVKTANGLKITTTPNHLFLVKKGKETCEKEAKDLKVGDYVATADKIVVEERDIDLSYGDLYFIGYFIGDGYTGVIEKNVFRGSPDITFNPKYPPNFDDSKLHKKYFLKIKEEGNVSHYVYSKRLREVFNELNMLTKDNKNIDVFYILPLEKLSHFIAGLFDSDGYINANRKKIGFSSISENLIKKLQLALLRFGIHSTIRKRKGKVMKLNKTFRFCKSRRNRRFRESANLRFASTANPKDSLRSPTNNKEYKSRDIYELIIGDFVSVKRFYENIPLRHKEKRRKLEEIVKSKEIAKMWCDCGFSIDLTMFKPRTKSQNELNKERVKLLFELLNGKKLVMNYNNYYSKRKNPHFEFIIREKIGGNKKGVYYSLNDKGKILMNLLNKNIKDKENLEEMYDFLVNLEKCPICGKPLYKEMRHSWKKEYYDGDIYWSMIKEIKKIKVNDKYAYDIELPDDGTNDHYVVANGFIVHNSAGLNLPCRRAIVRDLKRFSGRGMAPISKMEIQQCIGRAGRPGLDPYGEGIVYIKNPNDVEKGFEYLTGKVEDIYSKLSNQKVLRTHILGLISTREVENEMDLKNFIKNTFYAHQYGSLQGVLRNVKEVVDFLEDYDFIVAFTPTKLGKRVSELYIDPYSAKIIIDGLKKINKSSELNTNLELYMLYVLSMTTEMRPPLRVRNHEEEDLILEMMDLNIDDYSWENLESFKTAKMFYDWINEVPEEDILKRYGIEPGILKYKVEQVKWMAYSAKEIFNQLNLKNEQIKDCLSELEIRLEYGAKKDIIELLKIKHVGRVRARKLYDAGIRSKNDIVTNRSKVISLLGDKIGKKVLEGFGLKYGQQTLLSFQ
ncbi:DEAD/DEAH box helicase domain protein [Methanococcus aeolicus Nankai-3]|uniref:ATP-dependent DNA helicase Hel308 n=1 Tax=Methanococcus aeolicus (strain ATCC BAA-1280 / DSM 17508 / OCM 812 / Nankai-3) TaxID=419665 RepID=A6UT61_META3|nr:DEAD/DEAH box helicase [Methanococcus aeolicus]ABR55683.1 DEAD/DEAH box helicase domain protein [Methanococcus aeolicus Nankai-3]